MTIIEFLSRKVPDNICTSLLHKPDRVIFISHLKAKKVEKYTDRYKRFFESKGENVEFEICNINRNNISTILCRLEEIIQKYGHEDCVFDLTGGDDLYIFAAGIMCERHKDNSHLQMHRINILNGAIVDCDQDGRTIVNDVSDSDKAMTFTVADNVTLHGGKVVFEDERVGGTHRWTMDKDFRDDVFKLWNIYKDPRHKYRWNRYMQIFAVADKYSREENEGASFDPCVISTQRSVVREHMQQCSNSGTLFDDRFINELYDSGLITECRCSRGDEEIYIRFKNEQVKNCLTKSGQLLELVVYAAALEAEKKDGSPVYNDALTGVVIDWDGKYGSGMLTEGAQNEVDVVLMKGMVPVFISCKNGNFDVEELYKLQSVAYRFGGRLAKKVLIATKPEGKALMNEQAESEMKQKLDVLVERAEKMRIALKFDIDDISDEELIDTIASLAAN